MCVCVGVSVCVLDKIICLIPSKIDFPIIVQTSDWIFRLLYHEHYVVVCVRTCTCVCVRML